MNRLTDLTPYFAKDGVEIYCSDSMDVIDDIVASDAFVLADPPYGVSERTARKSAGRGKLAECNDFAPVIGDDKPFDPTPWLACDRLVLWGGNHFGQKLPSSGSWLIWDKRDGIGPNDNADAELAWTNLGGPARLFHHTWNGMIRASERDEARAHPTQKPVALMRWIIERYTEPGDLIIDPFMGSGPTLIAARETGRRAIGFDLSEQYCETAKRRLQSLLPFADLSFPKAKMCAGCNTTYAVKLGVTFNRKSSSPDGLQPWCRACDIRNKRDTKNGWTNFLRTLRDRNEVGTWTEAKYQELLGDYRCQTCGANVAEWGGGYWVDRISSKRGYIESNCRPSCWGCNRTKSNRNPESADQEIDRHVARYGRGKVPWDEIDPHIKHTESTVPDLSQFVIESPQLKLFGESR